MRIEGNVLVTGYHEFAFSLRTTGFPIYSITKDGVQEIGKTVKWPAKYPLPAGTLAVMRKYVSNSGIVYFTVYPLSGSQLCDGISVNEKNDFSVSDVPLPIRHVLSEWLKQQGFPVMSND